MFLSVASLFKAGALRVGIPTAGGWQWGLGRGAVASIGYSATMGSESGELRLSYTCKPGGKQQSVICTVRLSSLPLQYGGRRWYMHCPYTQRRVLKLYKFDDVEQFCCRTAIHPLPTYNSQRTSGAKRVIDQRWALRQRMGDRASNLLDEPFKPKWMRWRTFEKYAARDNELAGQMNGHLMGLLGHLPWSE
ncbi:MAG: hypothetical protein ABI247_12375 [Rhodanobacter sp.]